MADISASEAISGAPSRTAASGRLGVSTSASGSSARIAASASGASRRWPPLATMTGSSTVKVGRRAARTAATASITSGAPSMPSFTASTGTSSNTASAWAATKAGGSMCTSRTPRVFCTVRPVSAAMA